MKRRRKYQPGGVIPTQIQDSNPELTNLLWGQPKDINGNPVQAPVDEAGFNIQKKRVFGDINYDWRAVSNSIQAVAAGLRENHARRDQQGYYNNQFNPLTYLAKTGNTSEQNQFGMSYFKKGGKHMIPKNTTINGKKITAKQRKFFSDLCNMQLGGTILDPKILAGTLKAKGDNTNVVLSNNKVLTTPPSEAELQSATIQGVMRNQALKTEVAKRKQRIAASNNTKFLSKESFAKSAAGDKLRLFPNDPESVIDEYLNPMKMIGDMADNIGRSWAGNGSTKDKLLSLAAPVAGGALASIGAKTTGQFVNNVMNPVPLNTKEIFNLQPLSKHRPIRIHNSKEIVNSDQTFRALTKEENEKMNNMTLSLMLKDKELLDNINAGNSWKLTDKEKLQGKFLKQDPYPDEMSRYAIPQLTTFPVVNKKIVYHGIAPGASKNSFITPLSGGQYYRENGIHSNDWIMDPRNTLPYDMRFEKDYFGIGASRIPNPGSIYKGLNQDQIRMLMKRDAGRKFKQNFTDATIGLNALTVPMNKQGGYVNTTGYLDGGPTANNPYNIIPGGDITMQGVSQPIMATPIKNGQPMTPQVMQPGQDYQFDAEFVHEEPIKKKRKKLMNTIIPNNYGIYSGIVNEKGVNNQPTELEAIQTMIEYMKNNTPNSNVYRPQFQHHSVANIQQLPIGKKGGKVKWQDGGVVNFDQDFEDELMGSTPVKEAQVQTQEQEATNDTPVDNIEAQQWAEYLLGDTTYNPRRQRPNFDSDEPISQDIIGAFKQGIAGVESGGDYFAQGTGSSAFGKYQFIKGTRNEVRKQFFPQLSANEFETAYKSDPAFQEKVMDVYSSYLLSTSSSPQEAALKHFLGPAGAKKVTGMSYNPGGTNTNVGTYLQRFNQNFKFKQGGQYELEDSEIERLRAEGYDIEIL